MLPRLIGHKSQILMAEKIRDRVVKELESFGPVQPLMKFFLSRERKALWWLAYKNDAWIKVVDILCVKNTLKESEEKNE